MPLFRSQTSRRSNRNRATGMLRLRFRVADILTWIVEIENPGGMSDSQDSNNSEDFNNPAAVSNAERNNKPKKNIKTLKKVCKIALVTRIFRRSNKKRATRLLQFHFFVADMLTWIAEMENSEEISDPQGINDPTISSNPGEKNSDKTAKTLREVGKIAVATLSVAATVTQAAPFLGPISTALKEVLKMVDVRQTHVLICRIKTKLFEYTGSRFVQKGVEECRRWRQGFRENNWLLPGHE
jgi:hypothetical protein